MILKKGFKGSVSEHFLLTAFTASLLSNSVTKKGSTLAAMVASNKVGLIKDKITKRGNTIILAH